jgi:hypothetical protein
MESPATADEADDSYRTLGVGRSLPGSHDTKQQFTRVARKAAWAGHAWSNEERCLRALLTSHGFTISVFVAVAITATFAFLFEAPQEIVATLMVLGILTAVAESVLRSGSEHQS